MPFRGPMRILRHYMSFSSWIWIFVFPAPWGSEHPLCFLPDFLLLGFLTSCLMQLRMKKIIERERFWGLSFSVGVAPQVLDTLADLMPSDRFLFKISLAFLVVLLGSIGLLQANSSEPEVEVLNNHGFCKSKIPEAENYQKPNRELGTFIAYQTYAKVHLIPFHSASLFCSFLMFSSRPPINLCWEIQANIEIFFLWHLVLLIISTSQNNMSQRMSCLTLCSLLPHPLDCEFSWR